MADWWGFSRSNYFKVKDKEAFKAWLSDVGDVSMLQEMDDYIAIAGDSFGGWPTYSGDDCEEFDFVEELSGFLADDEVAVLIETGAEKLRYITGVAVAVDNRGKRADISLSDISAQAEAVLGRRPSDASY
jgi:hypothetical protein